ncbi:Multiple coagulation factor deficiency protein 2-like protein, partial [Armadillidium nasatum]
FFFRLHIYSYFQMENLNYYFFVILLYSLGVIAQHRSPPGVPPQQYQQGNQNQQYQQPPQQQIIWKCPWTPSGMSEEELQFHYFKMHDADNNNRLDGQELIKSLFHWHDSSNHDAKNGQAPPQPKIFTDDELTNMIDPIMDQDDRNRDGYIDYPEFVHAQSKAAAAAASSNTP